ncbi:MAG: aconitase family protein, partial [Dehalococcoidia bacterium]
ERLRFHLVGYGCTTCLGNSGPLPEAVAQAIREKDLVAAAVLSGNRNFEARINPLVRANYLASPILVVAYAIAGSVYAELSSEPIDYDANGQPVYLRELWPSQAEIQETIRRSLDPEMYRQRYASVFEGDEQWQALPIPEGGLYHWDPQSTYIQEPPLFEGFAMEPQPLRNIEGARVLAVLGDSVTTDHISPAGSIATESPAGRYLIERGVEPMDFNSYGARRGNHQVMMRGTFANVRLKNLLVPGTEGGWTVYHPTGERMPIYDAALRYQQEGLPLVVIVGKEYGSGSSRDWAAKGVQLLGVKAVIAESYERIHRSNLVGMGVLPLQFVPGENRESLGLSGHEVYAVEGVADGLRPGKEVTVRARRQDGMEVTFGVIVRIDSPVEVEYYRHGGILPAVLRRIVRGDGA